MTFKNCLGQFEPRIGNYLVRNIGTHWCILKDEGYYTTFASLAENPWWNIPGFDSMIQATIYMKQHLEELL